MARIAHEIVVGIDSSPAAERALARAVEEAEESRRGLCVVHAWTTPAWISTWPGTAVPEPNPRQFEKAAEHFAAAQVEKALAGARDRDALQVRTVVREGRAGHVLAEESADAGLLVVGGKGHGALVNALQGSTTSYVLHHVRCPVMVVPAGAGSMHAPRHVVVGADGSAASRSAMRWAAAASRRVGCRLEVVHAWLISTYPGAPSMVYVPPTEEYEQRARDWLTAEIADTLPRASARTALPRLLHSEAAAALLEAAGPDDLLVLGSRGRGGFTELLLGSVAAQCAQHARCPVVVVREGEERLSAVTDGDTLSRSGDGI